MNKNQKPKYLILAWGNPGRGDDAAGLMVAEAVARQVGDGVEIQCHHQLGPELCEDVAHAELVIFVDAHVCQQWPDLVVETVDPAGDYTPDSHSSSPEELLSLAGVLYHRQPKAHLVAMRAYDTTFGAPLSSRGEQLVAEGAKAVLDLLPAGCKAGV